MAVAENKETEASSPSPFDRLAVESLAGVFYVLGCIALVFYGLPMGWDNLPGLIPGSAISIALLIVAMIGVSVALSVVGVRLFAAHPKPGLRAGIFVGFVGLFSILATVSGVGSILETNFASSQGAMVSVGLTVGLGVSLLVLMLWYFCQPSFEGKLIQFEAQGWFSGTSYKRTQGLRVRRGTLIGLLVLAGSGIFVLVNHGVLDSGADTWRIVLPFTEGAFVPILPHVRFTLPLLLTALSLWMSYRIVSFPIFADFLIATEAEINKVSWTTRKRLIQDTIVVLVTVALMTTFLFVVDLLWAEILTRVGVLRLDSSAIESKDSKEVPW